ncbi:MAG: phosphoribosylanthranilate isomerase [Syntrophaceae bacterium]
MEIKICGITNLDDALNAYAFGADAIGFIFYQKSPRYVTPEAARHITDNLPRNIARVGVFVNHDITAVRDIYGFCGLDLIQLHGDESPEYCHQFPESVLIKAFSPKSDEELNDIIKFPVKAFLIDSRTADLYGGTGKKSNWELASKMMTIRPLILSGGLNPDNILEATETVVPHAVDVNSGVEASPRCKDPHKMKEVIEMAHGCNSRSSVTIFTGTFEYKRNIKS